MEEVLTNSAGVPSSADVCINGPQFTYTVPLNAGNVITSGTTVAVAAVPLTLAPSSTYVSNPLLTYGARHVGAAAQITTAGSLLVNRYLDTAGLVLNAGTPIASALVANTLKVIDNNDGTVFQSLTYEIGNTAGSAATLTTAMLVLQA